MGTRPGKTAAQTKSGAMAAAGQPRLCAKVLLAEDTGTDSKAIEDILRKAGHEVTIACDGRETVRQCRRRRFEIILMDLQMPIMDGLQATAAIRKLSRCRGGDATSPDVPIIGVTAHAAREAERQCRAAGMDAYLRKPVDACRVLQLIEEQVGPRRRGSGSACQPSEEPRTREDPECEEVVNIEATMARLAGDGELLQALIAIFLEDAPQLLERIETSLAGRDAAEAHRAAHSLKSLAANFNGLLAVRAAAAVERAFALAQFDKAQIGLTPLKQRIAQLTATLQRNAAP